MVQVCRGLQRTTGTAATDKALSKPADDCDACYQLNRRTQKNPRCVEFRGDARRCLDAQLETAASAAGRSRRRTETPRPSHAFVRAAALCSARRSSLASRLPHFPSESAASEAQALTLDVALTRVPQRLLRQSLPWRLPPVQRARAHRADGVPPPAPAAGATQL